MSVMLGKVVGLDLGSHTVKAVELRQTLRGVEIGRLKSVPAPAGAAVDPDALRNFFRAHQLPTERVVCAVPGDRVTRRLLRFPFSDRRRIAQAVPFEVEGEIPFPLEEVFVDWELVSGDRSRAEVVATVVPRSEVAGRLQGLEAAGVPARVVEAEGLVLANLAELLPLPGKRLLIDLGHAKTTLCLLVDGKPRAARTLPVGGRALSRAIASDRGLSEADAERLKCEEGVFVHGFDSRMPGALAVLDRLVRELLRMLGGLEAVLGGPAKSTLDEITLLGGGSRLHRIDEYLVARSGLATARLSVPPTPIGKAFLAAGDPLRYAPALALALRGTLRARTRMNFLQQEFAPRLDLRRMGQELRWTLRLTGAAAVLALAFAATAMVVESRRADRLEVTLRQLWSEAFPGAPVPPDVPVALRRSLLDAQQRADFLGVYRGNLSALDLFAAISARVPRDLPVVFEELTIDGQVIRIRGHTQSFEAVDRLRASLAGTDPFSEVRVSEIQADPTRGGNTFSVTISLAAPGAAA
jgi:general secretion pathway protein L